MKTLSFTLVFVVALLLNGCSSEPTIETRYYLLNQQISSQTNNQPSGDKTVVLAVKEFPEYLNQPQLVMQLADHQLHYAHFHMWAEPLQSGFSKALLTDLEQTGSNTRFVGIQSGVKQALQLQLEVDYFHANSEGKVTLSGFYWFKGLEAAPHQREAFYFEQALQHDGYPHSVAQMRLLVTQLAAQLVDKIQ